MPRGVSPSDLDDLRDHLLNLLEVEIISGPRSQYASLIMITGRRMERGGCE